MNTLGIVVGTSTEMMADRVQSPAADINLDLEIMKCEKKLKILKDLKSMYDLIILAS